MNLLNLNVSYDFEIAPLFFLVYLVKLTKINNANQDNNTFKLQWVMYLSNVAEEVISGITVLTLV